MPRHHLAIVTQPYLALILQGSKTIESRFTKVKCAPFGVVDAGDVVLLKLPGGPVVGEFTVGHVDLFHDLTSAAVRRIARKYAQQLCWDEEFLNRKLTARYATLLHIATVRAYEHPVAVVKRDRRAWVVLDTPQLSLLP
jgi:predicted transcriptional regulator